MSKTVKQKCVVLQIKDRGGGEVRIYGIEVGMIVNSSRRVMTIMVRRRGGWRRGAERIFHNDDDARNGHVRTHGAPICLKNKWKIDDDADSTTALI